jgi:hypothetical protein
MARLTNRCCARHICYFTCALVSTDFMEQLELLPEQIMAAHANPVWKANSGATEQAPSEREDVTKEPVVTGERESEVEASMDTAEQ